MRHDSYFGHRDGSTWNVQLALIVIVSILTYLELGFIPQNPASFLSSRRDVLGATALFKEKSRLVLMSKSLWSGRDRLRIDIPL